MANCTECGRENAEQTNFCRFCGQRIPKDAVPEQERRSDYQFAPPRPYAWKTDEYQTQAERRVKPQLKAARNPSQFAGLPPVNNGPPVYNGPQFMASNYRCPNCGTTVLPIIERRISSAGWITFSLLLVFTFVFFWIGLLMKENVTVCPLCRATLT